MVKDPRHYARPHPTPWPPHRAPAREGIRATRPAARLLHINNGIVHDTKKVYNNMVYDNLSTDTLNILRIPGATSRSS